MRSGYQPRGPELDLDGLFIPKGGTGAFTSTRSDKNTGDTNMPSFGEVVNDLSHFMEDVQNPYRSTLLSKCSEYEAVLKEIRTKFMELQGLEREINELSPTAFVHRETFLTRWLRKRAWRRLFHRRSVRTFHSGDVLGLVIDTVGNAMNIRSDRDDGL